MKKYQIVLLVNRIYTDIFNTKGMQNLTLCVYTRTRLSDLSDPLRNCWL
jgi:hypothetical protein